jgi:hypothetical protein
MGPEGVGKRRVANQLTYGAKGTDLQRMEAPLTKSGAREISSHHEHHPLTSPLRVTVADLSNAHSDAINALLKLVEEPPEYTRLVFHSDTSVPLTLRSRCWQVHFGLLSTTDVRAVLDRINPVGDLDTAALLSGGRVSMALGYLREGQSRADAEVLLHAVLQRRRDVLEDAFSGILKREGESVTEREARLDVLCRLLAHSIKTSVLQSADHALRQIPVALRVEALLVLDGRSRPSLRVKAGCYALLGLR